MATHQSDSRPSCSRSVKPRRAWLSLASVILLSLAVAGCSLLRSGASDRVTTSTLASQPISSSPTLPHPDTLREDAQDLSYVQQQLNWSARFRSTAGTAADGRFDSDVHTTMATLWSRELVEAQLVHELGINGLDDEVADRLRGTEMMQFQRLVRIRVHMFVNQLAPEALFATDLRPPRAELRLRDAEGNRFAHSHTYSGGVETYQHTSTSPIMLYRVNDLYFERTADDRDAFDTDKLQLRVRYHGLGYRDIFFEWNFEQEDQRGLAVEE